MLGEQVSNPRCIPACAGQTGVPLRLEDEKRGIIAPERVAETGAEPRARGGPLLR